MNVRDLECFKQVADVIGEKGALLHLGIVVNCRDVKVFPNNHLEGAFTWHNSPQGDDFWCPIVMGEKPHYKWNWKTNKAEIQPC